MTSTASSVSKVAILLMLAVPGVAQAEDRLQPNPPPARAAPVEHPMFLAMRKAIEAQRRGAPSPDAKTGQGAAVPPHGEGPDCAQDGECPVSS